MKIHIKDSTIIRPAQETPKHRLRNSDLDLSVPAIHFPYVHFYRRPNDTSNFFQADLLKESLRNVLVLFYPLAGRFGTNENGTLDIQCNGEGVLFLEAEASCIIDDFGDYESDWKHSQLAPTVDYAKDISSYPLLLIQVTRFKCGGVCLVVMLHHILADATSTFHFINAWAEMTRGLPISIPPFFDRTVLDLPTVHHIKHNPPPSTNTLIQNIESQSNPESISTAILKLSLDQMNMLEEKSKKDDGSDVKYSRFEILAAHIWRCACKAWGLSDDQASKLYIAINGRSRVKPAIPSSYFGNVVFSAKSISLAKNIQSEVLNSTIDRIHKAIKQMDDEYLTSALGLLKQRSDLRVLKHGFDIYKSPNLYISKNYNIPMYEANFGWGRPMFVRPGIVNAEGLVYILPSPTNDGSLSMVINLKTHHVQLFKKLFYEIFGQRQNVRARY